MPAHLVYVTAASRTQALEIARTLVQERLVACANVLSSITSLYWWEGAVLEETEVSFLAKTEADRVAEVIARVKALHSYQVPCVVSWPLTDGHPDFLRWITAETRPPSPGA